MNASAVLPPRLRALAVRVPLARVYDAATLLWITVFHHVLAARYRYAAFGFDERYFLHEGWSVTKGLVPYRDLQEFKPPMIFFVNALGIGLFGLDGLAYRGILSLLSLAGFLLLAAALLSRGTSRLLVAALLTLMVDHFFDRVFHDSSINNAETIGLDFFMIGCGLLLLRTRRERLGRVAGGALLALAPLSKEPLALVVLMAWLALLLLARLEAAAPGTAKRFARDTIAGAAGLVALWLVYMLTTSSLRAYFNELALSPPNTKNYAHQLKWFPKDPPGGLLAECWRRLRESYVNYGHLGAFVPLFLAPLAFGDRRRRLVGLAAVATFGAALYGVTIGRGFAPHYFIMAMTGTFFLAVVGALALDGAATSAGADVRRWVALTWVGFALFGTAPRFLDECARMSGYRAPAPPVSHAEVDFVRAHSAPGDTIFNVGDPLLYVYSDRTTAFREGIVLDELISYHPGATDEERLAGERQALLAKRPKLIVFGDDPVSYARKARYIAALVKPLLRDAGYVKVNDKFYVRP